MGSMREIAREQLDVAREGIGWIALWKEGRSWNAETFWPDYDEQTDEIRIAPDDLERLEEIAAEDPAAVFVNSYYHNLGGMDDLTRDDLTDGLRFQYERQTCNLARLLETLKQRTGGENMNNKQISEKIKDRIEEKGISTAAAAKLACMTTKQLQRSFEGKRALSGIELALLCRGLDLDFDDFKDPETESARVAALPYKNLRRAAARAGMLMEQVGALVGWSDDKLDEFLHQEYDPSMEEALAIQKAIAPDQPIAVLFRA